MSNRYKNSDFEPKQYQYLQKKIKSYSRVIIEKVTPEIDNGLFPVKRVIDEEIEISATIFADGHDELYAQILYKREEQNLWQSVPMEKLENDRFRGYFTGDELGRYVYTIKSGIDYSLTWFKGMLKKYEAGQNIANEVAVGLQLICDCQKRAKGKDKKELNTFVHLLKNQENIDEFIRYSSEMNMVALMQKYPDAKKAILYNKKLTVLVERTRARYSTWYEMFPRSCGQGQNHGTFLDCIKELPEIARMGFDVLYLPPIHPIGRINRKGKNNGLLPGADDPGSPWAIGSTNGGHTAIEPKLGTMDDFKTLLKEAKKVGMEIAMDIAFQCSPDHPSIKLHPEWFRFLPDGSIQYAENPPKKYEDIVPFDFESSQWPELWMELKGIFLFWADTGVRIFRVDNPHTKPFMFWDWVLQEVKKEYPEVIFLAEAFTRPHSMYRLAKGGFNQSYTYFTWRNTKQEFIEYMNQLTKTKIHEFFRPNFWCNTPDILPEHLQTGHRPAFIIRLILAATLSSNYGMYGPAFELLESDAIAHKEEYVDSEKYEIKDWDRNKGDHLRDLIALVNTIRRDNPALQLTGNIEFCSIDNDFILSYYKTTKDCQNIILVVVNLDPYNTQIGNVSVPIGDLGIQDDKPYQVHDLLSDEKYYWHGSQNYIELNPQKCPAHIILLKGNMRPE